MFQQRPQQPAARRCTAPHITADSRMLVFLSTPCPEEHGRMLRTGARLHAETRTEAWSPLGSGLGAPSDAEGHAPVLLDLADDRCFQFAGALTPARYCADRPATKLADLNRDSERRELALELLD